MPSPSKIYVKRASFKSDDDMFCKLHDLTRNLIDTGNIVEIHRSIITPDVMVVEFSSVEPGFSECLPMWLSPEEMALVSAMRQAAEDDGQDDDRKSEAVSNA